MHQVVTSDELDCGIVWKHPCEVLREADERSCHHRVRIGDVLEFLKAAHHPPPHPLRTRRWAGSEELRYTLQCEGLVSISAGSSAAQRLHMALAREGVTFAEARIPMHAANKSDFREMIDMAPRFSFTVSASALRKALSVRDHVYRRSDDNWLAFVACDRPGGRTLLVATLEGGDLRGAAVKSTHAIPDKSGGGRPPPFEPLGGRRGAHGSCRAVRRQREAHAIDSVPDASKGGGHDRVLVRQGPGAFPHDVGVCPPVAATKGVTGHVAALPSASTPSG